MRDRELRVSLVLSLLIKIAIEEKLVLLTPVCCICKYN